MLDFGKESNFLFVFNFTTKIKLLPQLKKKKKCFKIVSIVKGDNIFEFRKKKVSSSFDLKNFFFY